MDNPDLEVDKRLVDEMFYDSKKIAVEKIVEKIQEFYMQSLADKKIKSQKIIMYLLEKVFHMHATKGDEEGDFEPDILAVSIKDYPKFMKTFLSYQKSLFKIEAHFENDFERIRDISRLQQTLDVYEKIYVYFLENVQR